MTATRDIEVRPLIARLGLARHPEGGWYRETYRSAAASAILFLLAAGERSHWHRVDADEAWLWHAGSPLLLDVATADGAIARTTLGGDVLAGEQPQRVVPANAWQAAEAGAGWALVSCVVAPPFRFAGFELAPPGWSPV